jgi:hypothetical protein
VSAVRRHPAEDLTGRKFHKWEVLKRPEKPEHNGPVWLCRRECGAERVIPSGTLVQGKSCRRCSDTRRHRGRPELSAHLPALARRVWPHTCATCGKKFNGTASQRYCTRSAGRP